MRRRMAYCWAKLTYDSVRVSMAGALGAILMKKTDMNLGAEKGQCGERVARRYGR